MLVINLEKFSKQGLHCISCLHSQRRFITETRRLFEQSANMKYPPAFNGDPAFIRSFTVYDFFLQLVPFIHYIGYLCLLLPVRLRIVQLCRYSFYSRTNFYVAWSRLNLAEMSGPSLLNFSFIGLQTIILKITIFTDANESWKFKTECKNDTTKTAQNKKRY